MLSAIGLVLCPSSTYIGTVDEQARYMPMTLPYSNTSSMAEKEFKLNLVLNLSTSLACLDTRNQIIERNSPASSGKWRKSERPQNPKQNEKPQK